MEPVRRTGLIDQVKDVLRAEIVSGRWALGAKIPTEVELGELTGTGRNTVREAVQSLVHAGLLERRQGSGTYVTATSEMSGVLGHYLSAARHRELLELRLALDVSAAELAAVRRTEADVVTLHARLGERRAARVAGDPVATATADLDLHRAVIRASGNGVFDDVYESLVPALGAAIEADMRELDDTYEAEHAQLVQAIVDRDPERAGRAARRLLDALLEDRAASD